MEAETNRFRTLPPGVFADQRYLDLECTPKRLVARDAQIDEVTALFAPLITRGAASNAMIYGKPGTGKSAVVNYVIRQLQEVIEEDGLDDVYTIQVVCATSTVSTVLVEIIRQINPLRNVPERGLSYREYIEIVFREMNARKGRAILILDEMDLLPNHAFLYQFSRGTEQKRFDEGVGMTIIGISNDTEFYKTLDPRIQSTMQVEDIIFKSYSAPELAAILNDRTKAFVPGALGDEIVPLCAGYAAQVDGNARYAIQLLKKAGKVAERNGATVITDAHVRDAREILETETTMAMIKTLTTINKIIVEAVITLSVPGGPLPTATDVFNRYAEISAVLDIDPLSRRRLIDLIGELDMLGIINRTVVSRGRYGRTMEIGLKTDPEITRGVVLADPRMENWRAALEAGAIPGVSAPVATGDRVPSAARTTQNCLWN